MATQPDIKEGSEPKSNGKAPVQDVPKTEAAVATTQSSPWPKRLWKKSGLSVDLLSTMFKGACPPVIALALYQATPFANHFGTIGYLVGIMSVLSFAILPRAKFFQTMIFNVIGVCVGAAIALLTVYCSVQARLHTTFAPATVSGGPVPGAAVASYNSSASAVCAIWLFVNIFVSNSLRFTRPQLQLPVIIYSIFANVSSTYAPQFDTMTQGIDFVEKLLEGFLSGFAIAAVVNVFVFPKSSRDVVFKEAVAYMKAIQRVLKAQNAYLQSLEREDMFRSNGKGAADATPQGVSTAKAFKAALAALTALHGKLRADLTFAKREVDYGHLGPKELDELFQRFRGILLPLIGMGSVVDIFNRIADHRGWKVSDDEDDAKATAERLAERERKDKEVRQWNEVMRTLHEPFELMSAAMNDGLQHASYVLGLTKRPKAMEPNAAGDLEAGKAEGPGQETRNLESSLP
ncbi:hypothetical protein MMC13_003520 [Lambiella insularis]|nr:hypothetical protein [Lambiella insularis]